MHYTLSSLQLNYAEIIKTRLSCFTECNTKSKYDNISSILKSDMVN